MWILGRKGRSRAFPARQLRLLRLSASPPLKPDAASAPAHQLSPQNPQNRRLRDSKTRTNNEEASEGVIEDMSSREQHNSGGGSGGNGGGGHGFDFPSSGFGSGGRGGHHQGQRGFMKPQQVSLAS